jgi:5-methylcytosine-specific restriction endonuclease McrA
MTGYADRQYQTNKRLVLEAAAGRCQMNPYCTRTATTVDHIVPLALGGTHDLANLRAACKHHNSAAGARLLNANRRFAAKGVGRRSRPW